MKIKRLLALLFSMLMVVTCFAGCKGGESGGNKKADSLRADLDFNGETIKIVVPPGYGLISDGTDPELVARDEKLAELGKKYNGTFVFQEGVGSYWSLMATTIASGKPAGHIMITQENYFMNWVKAGAMADLTAAMEKTGIDFTDSRYNQTIRKATNFNGAQYCFYQAPLAMLSNIWFFNKRIFEEYNLGDPYQMVEDGTWNWDAVENIAKKALVKKSDGTVEQWGFTSYSHTSLLTALCVSNGTTVSDFDKNGNPVLNLNSSKGMKAFEKFYDWTVVQKIAKVNDGKQNYDTYYKEFAEGKVALTLGGNSLLKTLSEMQSEDDFGIVAPPMGPDADKYYYQDACGEMYFIPKTYEDMADKLLLVMDELLYTEASHEDRVSEKYISYFRDEKALDSYVKQVVDTENKVYDASNMVDIIWGGEPSLHDLIGTVLKGEKSPGDAMEASKVQIQKSMEDNMGEYKRTSK